MASIQFNKPNWNHHRIPVNHLHADRILGAKTTTVRRLVRALPTTSVHRPTVGQNVYRTQSAHPTWLASTKNARIHVRACAAPMPTVVSSATRPCASVRPATLAIRSANAANRSTSRCTNSRRPARQRHAERMHCAASKTVPDRAPALRIISAIRTKCAAPNVCSARTVHRIGHVYSRNVRTHAPDDAVRMPSATHSIMCRRAVV